MGWNGKAGRGAGVRRWAMVLVAGAVAAAVSGDRVSAMIVRGGVDLSDTETPEGQLPGFQLQKEDIKSVGKLEDFDRYVGKKAWELAFRTMSNFSDTESSGMVPGKDG